MHILRNAAVLDRCLKCSVLTSSFFSLSFPPFSFSVWIVPTLISSWLDPLLVSIPTDHFTTLELQNPPHDVSELHKKCRSPDVEALKLRKGRPGLLAEAPSSRRWNLSLSLQATWLNKQTNKRRERERGKKKKSKPFARDSEQLNLHNAFSWAEQRSPTRIKRRGLRQEFEDSPRLWAWLIFLQSL